MKRKIWRHRRKNSRENRRFDYSLNYWNVVSLLSEMFLSFSYHNLPQWFGVCRFKRRVCYFIHFQQEQRVGKILDICRREDVFECIFDVCKKALSEREMIFCLAYSNPLLGITGKLVLALRVAVRFDIFFIIIRFLFCLLPFSDKGK